MTCYVIFTLIPTIALTSAFSGISKAYVSRHVQTTSKLPALIYGWDGDDVEDETTPYTDIFNDVDDAGQCSAMGAAIAESLTQDKDRIGNLARLAVAFSPPERKIALNNIENIEVTCVREDKIELLAMLCEVEGCVSLSVPVKFPRDCGSDLASLESCVTENLDSLTVEVESKLRAIEQVPTDAELDLDELFQLNQKVDYPIWWVPPFAELAEHCDDIRRLLNEDEFQYEIQVLAREGLSRAGKADAYVVRKVKVASVGPAGVCLKVAAAFQNQEDLHFLDVMCPFGGEPMQDVESLRAAVLGAIAAAEDVNSANVYGA